MTAAAFEVLGKISGQVFRGFANVSLLVRDTNTPDGTSFPHPTGICRRVYFVLVQTCAVDSCRKSVQLQFPPVFATDFTFISKLQYWAHDIFAEQYFAISMSSWISHNKHKKHAYLIYSLRRIRTCILNFLLLLISLIPTVYWCWSSSSMHLPKAFSERFLNAE